MNDHRDGIDGVAHRPGAVAGVTARPGPEAVVLADASTGFSGVIDQWRSSLGADIDDLSLSPEWTLRAAQSAGLADQLHMLGVVSEDGRLSACGAYVDGPTKMYGVPLRLREMPGNRLVAYHHQIAGPGAADLIDAVACAGGEACDVLCIPSVPSGSATERIASECAERNGWRLHRLPGYRSPFIPIAGTWEEFLKGMSSNFRYNLKRKARALAALGRLTEKWFTTNASVDELLECMHRIEGSSWKAEADMAITGSNKETAYYGRLLPWLGEVGALSANVIYIDSAPAAYSLCYLWRGRISQMKTSFDERFSEGSPGLAVNAAAIRHAFESGASEFDFLGDVMPHKMHWTNEVRPHCHLFLYTGTIKGRMIGAAKRLAERLRPHAAPVTSGRGAHRSTGARDEER